MPVNKFEVGGPRKWKRGPKTAYTRETKQAMRFLLWPVVVAVIVVVVAVVVVVVAEVVAAGAPRLWPN
jgi:hypothetical protein